MWWRPMTGSGESQGSDYLLCVCLFIYLYTCTIHHRLTHAPNTQTKTQTQTPPQHSNWRPSFTTTTIPERVVLARAARLAGASLSALLRWMECGGGGGDEGEEGWRAAVCPAAVGAMGRGLWGQAGFDVVVK